MSIKKCHIKELAHSGVRVVIRIARRRSAGEESGYTSDQVNCESVAGWPVSHDLQLAINLSYSSQITIVSASGKVLLSTQIFIRFTFEDL